MVPVNVSWSDLLLEVDDGWLNSVVCKIRCVSPACVRNTYRPSYFSSCQHNLRRLLCDQHPIPSDTFPKRSGHSSLFCYYIFDLSEEIFLCSRFNYSARVLFNCFARVNCFARNLFNCFARIWFNFFARNYTLIFLIFAESDLKIFLSPIFLLLWVYTITINGNVGNVIEMCRTLFWIRCTCFWFLVKTINISLQVLVRCMQ